MFDELVVTKTRARRVATTVAFAAAAHLAAIVLAVLWTTPPPPPPLFDEGIRVVPQMPGEGREPKGTPAPKGKRGEKKAATKPRRKPDLKRIERVEKTIEIEVPAPAPAVEPEPGLEPFDEGEPGEGAHGNGDPNGVAGGTGPTIGGQFGSGPPIADEPVRILGSDRDLTAPRPSGSCRPPAPAMPEQARLTGVTGRVLVQFIVRPDGRVTDVLSLDRGAAPVLVEAVRSWLERCPFEAALYRGRPVPVKMSQSFNFRLH